jgi:hypothetical protein
MNSKKDEPGKKDPLGSSGPGGSRPHATLDLKATVVDAKGGKEEKPVAQEAAGARASATRPAAGGGGTASAGPAQSKPASAAAKPQSSQGADKSATKAPAAAGGRGGFFTHLTAGVAGGIIALLAADMLATQLGLSGSGERPDATAALQQRIAALETAAKKGATDPQLAARLKAAETKIGKLEQVDAGFDRLSKEQSALARNVETLETKVGTQADDGDTNARLTKLEEQLSTLSAAAEDNPDGAGLPQLAAITGKVADLQSTMTNQLDALRESVNEEIDTRLQAATESSEAAKSGTQRIDRELSGIKADTSQLSTRLNTLSAESDRALSDLRTTQEELTRLKVELNARLPKFARPEDVSAAVKPVTDKLTKLEDELQSVIKSEDDRKATAGRIVLSLELADLKRAIDRGKGYATELAQAQTLSRGSLDLAPLSRFAETGVPTLAELRQDFKAVAFKIIDAEQTPADGSIVDRLLAGAKSVVRVRKINHEASDNSAEAIVARIEEALAEDRLQDVLDEAKTLPQPAQDAAKEFLAKVEARHAVDQALASVETQLKTSLVAPSAPGEETKQ